MKHPYADILIAIAEGKEIQRNKHGDRWIDLTASEALNEITYEKIDPSSYRIKPAKITINGCEVESPVPNGDNNWLRVHTQVAQKTITFATITARNAAYAALIKPFESAS